MIVDDSKEGMQDLDDALKEVSARDRVVLVTREGEVHELRIEKKKEIKSKIYH